jgi:dTDP-4-amino-4,6-dideoxygalactose transaminase
MAVGAHKITAEFEEAIAKYTGSTYAVALDNCSNAIFLSLLFDRVEGKEVIIPSHTYPSVPCEIIHAGGRVVFIESPPILKGAYQLGNTNVVDSALTFTSNMYSPGKLICLSFTGPYKHLKLGKGGAILTDRRDAYLWFKRVRFSGRRECSYHEDNFDCLGWNFYMMPEIAARGLQLMQQFYDYDGNPIKNEDISLRYPDLSSYPIYKGMK